MQSESASNQRVEDTDHEVIGTLPSSQSKLTDEPHARKLARVVLALLR